MLSIKLKNKPYERCDKWSKQTTRYQFGIFAIFISILLGLAYGICIIAEFQILKRMKAFKLDKEENCRKFEKTVYLRTSTACIGFTLAILNIGIEAFIDEI